MARPKNADQSVEVRVSVLPVVRDWLDELAKLGVFGKNRAAVAEHFVRAGVEAELRQNGFLSQNGIIQVTKAARPQNGGNS
jgi:hypothetical protein